jgi:hypothetical protein
MRKTKGYLRSLQRKQWISGKIVVGIDPGGNPLSLFTPELPRWCWVHLLPESATHFPSLFFSPDILRSIRTFKILTVRPGITAFHHFTIYIDALILDNADLAVIRRIAGENNIKSCMQNKITELSVSGTPVCLPGFAFMRDLRRIDAVKSALKEFPRERSDSNGVTVTDFCNCASDDFVIFSE